MDSNHQSPMRKVTRIPIAYVLQNNFSMLFSFPPSSTNLASIYTYLYTHRYWDQMYRYGYRMLAVHIFPNVARMLYSFFVELQEIFGLFLTKEKTPFSKRFHLSGTVCYDKIEPIYITEHEIYYWSRWVTFCSLDLIQMIPKVYYFLPWLSRYSPYYPACGISQMEPLRQGHNVLRSVGMYPDHHYTACQ